MHRPFLAAAAGCALIASTALALEIPPSYLSELAVGSPVAQMAQTADGRILLPLIDYNVVLVVNASGTELAQFGQFNQPTGVAIDAAGNIYVCDQFNHRVVKFSPTFDLLLEMGGVGSDPGQLMYPTNCAVSLDQTKLYVTELGNHRVSVFDLAGQYQSFIGSHGSGPGQFDSPFAIVVEPGSGDLFITNQVNQRVDHFTAAGAWLSSFGQAGTGPDDFQYPVGLCMDAAHNLWITDQLNNRIKKTTRDGTLLAEWGTFGAGAGEFYNPWSVFVPEDGTVWVGDTYNYRVQVFGFRPVPAKRESWAQVKQRFR